MASLLRSLLRANETTPIAITDWAKQFRPGQQFMFGGTGQQAYDLTAGGTAGIYESDSVAFACEQKRLQIFAEARFQWQQMRAGRPGDLFGSPALSVLEEPWRGAHTGNLLARSELDVAETGNSFWIRDPIDDDYLIRLLARDMRIVTEAAVDSISGFKIGERLVGYAHVQDRGRQVTYFEPEQIAHYKPIPHPSNQFLGMSWLNPCLPDVQADQDITRHRTSSLRGGGQLGYVVTMPPDIEADDFDDFVAAYRRDHEGPQNSGKTLFIGGGADVKTVGQSFADLALQAEQGHSETRIAACAGIHPVIAGLSEGLGGSALNAGNYSAAKRSTVDSTIRPMWRDFAGAFASIMPAVSAARLWYDDRDIPFLREDVKDQAEVFGLDMGAVVAGINGGFTPDAVITAVAAGDIRRLSGQHTGLVSVQLQKPGAPSASNADPGGASA